MNKKEMAIECVLTILTGFKPGDSFLALKQVLYRNCSTSLKESLKKELVMPKRIERFGVGFS